MPDWNKLRDSSAFHVFCKVGTAVLLSTLAIYAISDAVAHSHVLFTKIGDDVDASRRKGSDT